MSILWGRFGRCVRRTIQTVYGASFQQRGVHANREIVDAGDLRRRPRIKFEKGLSERAIARSLSLSAGAVNGYLQRSRLAGLSWPLPDGLDDTALERLLFAPTPPAAAAARPVPDWTVVERELRRRGVTLALLWEEYRAGRSDGFGYSWFCEQYAAFKSRMRPTMRQTHIAGEKVFVDFAGDTIESSIRRPVKCCR